MLQYMLKRYIHYWTPGKFICLLDTVYFIETVIRSNGYHIRRYDTFVNNQCYTCLFISNILRLLTCLLNNYDNKIPLIN